MTLVATVVEWGELGKTVLAAGIGGVGVTVIYAVAVLGVARWSDLRRDERPVAAAVAASTALLALAAFAVAIVLGLIVMTDK